MTAIPSLSMSDLRGDSRSRQRFQTGLGEALKGTGFVRFRNHGIPHDIIRSAYKAAAAFFALPPEIKLLYERPEVGRQRGYTPLGVEHAQGNPNLGDLKEFWHRGRTLSPQHKFFAKFGANHAVKEVEVFDRCMEALYRALENLANEILAALSLLLGKPDWWLPRFMKGGDSLLRLINYPPLEGLTFPPGSLRSAAHRDIDLITLLLVSEGSGLEIFTRDGHWIAVDNDPDEVILNLGDMFEFLSGGFYPSTIHRVVNPDGSTLGRMSCPFFDHPTPDKLLCVVDRFRLHDGAEHFVTQTAGHFLYERLIEIGVFTGANPYPF